MIKKEDVKVGLRFYITGNDCLRCNFAPTGIQSGSTPILFNAEGNDADVYICTSVGTDCEYVARFREEDIMMFGTRFDMVTEGEGEAANGKAEQVSHPSHYAWLKDLCGVEPLDICRHLDFNTGNAIKYLLRKDKVDGGKTKTEKRIEDLRKAVFYIQDEIKSLEHGTD